MNGPDDLARGWMQKADSDLAAAHQVLAGPGPYDTVCFHAQQAIEKCLKAVLAHAGEPIPRTHNLEELADRTHEVAPAFAADPDELAEITPFAVELRYDPEFWPDRETAAAAVAAAVELRAEAEKALPPAARPASG